MSSRNQADVSPASRPPVFLVAAVSLYLIVVGAWLLLARRIPSPGFRRILAARFSRRYVGVLQDFTAEEGLCFTVPVPENMLSDRESASRLRLFEDESPVGLPHCSHDDIRRLGGGRYSHWGPTFYFSTPDNTDPRTNRRRYVVRETRN
jgi:hypothetical protein